MTTNGTYGDELTLYTASNIYNINITLVLSLVREGKLEIKPPEFQSFRRIVVGHFVERYENIKLI